MLSTIVLSFHCCPSAWLSTWLSARLPPASLYRVSCEPLLALSRESFLV